MKYCLIAFGVARAP